MAQRSGVPVVPGGVVVVTLVNDANSGAVACSSRVSFDVLLTQNQSSAHTICSRRLPLAPSRSRPHVATGGATNSLQLPRFCEHRLQYNFTDTAGFRSANWVSLNL